jgi:hypothetical protein
MINKNHIINLKILDNKLRKVNKQLLLKNNNKKQNPQKKKENQMKNHQNP